MADAQMLMPVDHDPFADAGAIPGLMGKPDAPPQGLGPSVGFGLPIGMAGGVAGYRAGESAVDAAMLPGDVYQGKVDLGSDAGLGRVVNMAGTLAGAGMPMAEAGAAGIFGGRLAKTADLGALKEAEGLAAAGADRDTIWNKTGWFTGADGQWRFEIPDNQANMGNKFVDELMGSSGDHGSANSKVAGALWHPDLYNAYPNIRNTDVRAQYDPAFPGGSGSYYRNALRDNPDIKLQTQMVYGPEGTEGVLLHELQHGVQYEENFARGSSPSTSIDLLDDYITGVNARLSSLAKQMDAAPKGSAEHAAMRNEYDTLMQERSEKLSGFDSFDAYKRHAGEVEARNVQRRMAMTPEERRATPPWATQDVPDAQQIVRLPNGRTATMMSVDHDPFAPRTVPVDHDPFIEAYHGSPHSFDQFDIGKIGTGEGAQAYGHGLYFAEKEGVAKDYRDALAPGYRPTLNGVPFGTLPEPERRVAQWIANTGAHPAEIAKIADQRAAKTLTEARELGLEDIGEIAAREHSDTAAAARALAEGGKWDISHAPNGSMYHVRINADPEHFLDWDKPLGEQHPKSQDAVLSARFGGDPEQIAKAKSDPDFMSRSMGAMMYDLSHPKVLGSAEKASAALREAGIPGIKYLDAGSRGAADGTRNHVVFDDKLVEILRKYGIAGLTTLGGGAAALGANGFSLSPVDHDPFGPPTGNQGTL